MNPIPPSECFMQTAEPASRLRSMLICILWMCLSVDSALAVDKTIGVFIALADNQNQGIVPVPEAIGNGEDPERNLYWGTAEGLKGVFDRSETWKLVKNTESPLSPAILRMRVYRNERRSAALTAMAYKGSAIRECIQDFETAILNGSYDMAVYIGHNGLMDFNLPEPVKLSGPVASSDCIVLCCRSAQYFKKRIETAGGRPLLMTTQLMYPGSFILLAVLESWLDGNDRRAIRESAGAAYAKNQKLSKKAGMGIFADLGD